MCIHQRVETSKGQLLLGTLRRSRHNVCRAYQITNSKKLRFVMRTSDANLFVAMIGLANSPSTDVMAKGMPPQKKLIVNTRFYSEEG